MHPPFDPRDLKTFPGAIRPAGFSERRHRRVQIERSRLARHLVRDDQHHQSHESVVSGEPEIAVPRTGVTPRRCIVILKLDYYRDIPHHCFC